MSLSYSNYTPPFNTSTAGLKSQPGLKFLHVTSPLVVLTFEKKDLVIVSEFCSNTMYTVEKSVILLLLSDTLMRIRKYC